MDFWTAQSARWKRHHSRGLPWSCSFRVEPYLLIISCLTFINDEGRIAQHDPAAGANKISSRENCEPGGPLIILSAAFCCKQRERLLRFVSQALAAGTRRGRASAILPPLRASPGSCSWPARQWSRRRTGAAMSASRSNSGGGPIYCPMNNEGPRMVAGRTGVFGCGVKTKWPRFHSVSTRCPSR